MNERSQRRGWGIITGSVRGQGRPIPCGQTQGRPETTSLAATEDASVRWPRRYLAAAFVTVHALIHQARTRHHSMIRFFTCPTK